MKAEIYTDGSFSSSVARAGWGFVVVEEEVEMYRGWGSIDGGPLIKHRNIAGEVRAVEEGLKWSIENGYTEVEICCDYEGLIHWAQGTWQAKNDLTKRYSSYLKSLKGIINIRWRKIRAHSGDKWNDIADELAGLGSSANLTQ